MIKTIRVLALSLTLGIWAIVSVDALNAKQLAQVAVNANLSDRGIVDRADDGTVNLLGFGQQQVVECNSNAVQITGNHGSITLRGTCSEVILVGNDNLVRSETVGTISVTGNNNNITWISGLQGQPPQVTRSGKDNLIAQAE